MTKFKIILTSLIISTSSYILPMHFIHVIPVNPNGQSHEFGQNLVPSPLIRQSVLSGNLEMLQELIKNGANPHNYRGNNYGESLLHCAAASGQSEMITYLVNVIGIAPNIRDSSGATPAHYAAGNTLTKNLDKVAILRLLKTLGADMTAKDNEGSSIIKDAIEAGSSREVLQQLISLVTPE